MLDASDCARVRSRILDQGDLLEQASSELQALLDKLWVWLEEGKLRKHLRLPRLAVQEHRELEAEAVEMPHVA